LYRARHDDVSNSYRRLRFAVEIIEPAVWLRHFPSLRGVETILGARDVVVRCGSIREWGLRFGRVFAKTPIQLPRVNNSWQKEGGTAASLTPDTLIIQR